MYRQFDPENQFKNANGSLVWEALGALATNDSAISVGRIELPPGSMQVFRRNAFAEVLIVVSGACVVEIDGEIWPLQANDVAQIPAGATYRERVIGDKPCLAWAICTPAYQRDLVEYLHEQPT